MRSRGLVAPLGLVLLLAACATPPPSPSDDLDEPFLARPITAPSPMIEYPPIEPVEPPVSAERVPELEPVASAPVPLSGASPPGAPSPATPSPDALSQAALAPATPVTPPPIAPPIAPPTPPPTVVSVEQAQLVLLIADLQRIGELPAADARRELKTMTQTLARQRDDLNRVRLATLYTVAKANPQDDLRALQLLENVARSDRGSAVVKQLAAVLHAQISERVRAVREEQLRADVAIQKLEALRAMERSLLRERARGGGGGTGSGAGAGGAGGSGGAGDGR